jgi:hypothetical protein
VPTYYEQMLSRWEEAQSRASPTASVVRHSSELGVGGYHMYTDSNFGFLQLEPEHGVSNSDWKFHLSVAPEDVSKAWHIFVEELAKDGDKHLAKVVKPDTAQRFANPESIQAGKMITLYENGEYSPQQYANLLARVESRFDAAGIEPGPATNADRAIPGSRYGSYRRETDPNGDYMASSHMRNVPKEQRFNPHNSPDPYETINFSGLYDQPKMEPKASKPSDIESSFTVKDLSLNGKEKALISFDNVEDARNAMNSIEYPAGVEVSYRGLGSSGMLTLTGDGALDVARNFELKTSTPEVSTPKPAANNSWIDINKGEVPGREINVHAWPTQQIENLKKTLERNGVQVQMKASSVANGENVMRVMGQGNIAALDNALKSITPDQTSPKPDPSPEKPAIKFQDIPTADGSSKIVSISQRPMVVAEVNGVNVPFYVSTGAGGKENVAVGQWYPIMGIGEDGWFNKGGSEADINNYYNNEDLRRVAEFLNKNYGDLRGDTRIPAVPNSPGSYEAAGPHMDVINRDMMAMRLNEYRDEQFRENIQRVSGNDAGPAVRDIKSEEKRISAIVFNQTPEDVRSVEVNKNGDLIIEVKDTYSRNQLARELRIGGDPSTLSRSKGDTPDTMKITVPADRLPSDLKIRLADTPTNSLEAKVSEMVRDNPTIVPENTSAIATDANTPSASPDGARANMSQDTSNVTPINQERGTASPLVSTESTARKLDLADTLEDQPSKGSAPLEPTLDAAPAPQPGLQETFNQSAANEPLPAPDNVQSISKKIDTLEAAADVGKASAKSARLLKAGVVTTVAATAAGVALTEYAHNQQQELAQAYHEAGLLSDEALADYNEMNEDVKNIVIAETTFNQLPLLGVVVGMAATEATARSQFNDWLEKHGPLDEELYQSLKMDMLGGSSLKAQFAMAGAEMIPRDLSEFPPELHSLWEAKQRMDNAQDAIPSGIRTRDGSIRAQRAEAIAEKTDIYEQEKSAFQGEFDRLLADPSTAAQMLEMMPQDLLLEMVEQTAVARANDTHDPTIQRIAEIKEQLDNGLGGRKNASERKALGRELDDLKEELEQNPEKMHGYIRDVFGGYKADAPAPDAPKVDTAAPSQFAQYNEQTQDRLIDELAQDAKASDELKNAHPYIRELAELTAGIEQLERNREGKSARQLSKMGRNAQNLTEARERLETVKDEIKANPSVMDRALHSQSPLSTHPFDNAAGDTDLIQDAQNMGIDITAMPAAVATVNTDNTFQAPQI